LVLYHHDGAVVEVRLEGRPLKMSPLERSLMALLATSPGEPVLHHFLVSELEVSDKHFNTLVHQVRGKVGGEHVLRVGSRSTRAVLPKGSAGYVLAGFDVEWATGYPG